MSKRKKILLNDVISTLCRHSVSWFSCFKSSISMNSTRYLRKILLEINMSCLTNNTRVFEIAFRNLCIVSRLTNNLTIDETRTQYHCSVSLFRCLISINKHCCCWRLSSFVCCDLFSYSKAVNHDKSFNFVIFFCLFDTLLEI